jgi:hypothetical protein
MTPIRDYRLECCWFVLLVLIVLLTPSSSAQALSWADLAFDCDSVTGWCIGFGDGPGHSPIERLFQD